jgi:hypothetical protein
LLGRGSSREGILSFTIEMVNDGRLSGRGNLTLRLLRLALPTSQ